ncbi:TetR/AcrR family transcriptional regulator [Komagataeibacter xylinus]|uniref:TetR/AcrR family transcriptional regulator n=1 Tax=Komagataeibacter xylinus TaxID=28448 RepID=UPI00280B2778|nr:TetR/AcrR family transcriptional regulator [Komagataeibacter xylinus]
MRYPAEETAAKHQRLLNAASELFRQRGINDVSVSEVMKAAGMTHGAFPSHFGSKDELASAAIREAMDQADATLSRALADPVTAKETFLQNYLSRAHRDGAGNGCPMAALAVEIGRREPDKPALSRHLGKVIERIARGFRWSGGGDRREKAILTTAAMVGAVILARSVDDGELSDEILAATRRQLLAS